MTIHIAKYIIGVIILASCMVFSTAAAAHSHGGGHHGSGKHGNSWKYNKNYYHHGWHNNYWYGSGFYIGIPSGGYYGPSCTRVKVCNSYGNCWLEQQCY